jgi:outer membrane receptor protein involved in Fe transport
VTAGTSFDANTTRSSFFQTSDGGDLGSQPEYAAFVQGEIAPLTGLDVVAGVRFDAYGIEATKTITRLSPKVALSYASSEAFALRMAYGKGFRVASLAERFTDDQSFIPIFRNPEIRPETSTSYELGAKGWFEAGSAGRLVWDLALFWNDYADFIEPRFVRTGSGGETLFGFQFVNLTSGRIRGAEVGLLWRPGPAGLRFRIGYTYLDTEDRETGEALPFRPEHLLVTTAEAEPRDGLRFGLDYRVSSVPEKIDSDFALFVPDASVMVATYALDARASMRWGGFTASILIKNVLDYYYLERPAILAPPRNLTVRIEVDL